MLHALESCRNTYVVNFTLRSGYIRKQIKRHTMNLTPPKALLLTTHVCEGPLKRKIVQGGSLHIQRNFCSFSPLAAFARQQRIVPNMLSALFHTARREAKVVSCCLVRTYINFGLAFVRIECDNFSHLLHSSTRHTCSCDKEFIFTGVEDTGL